MSDSNLYLALREGSQASQRRDTTIRWVKGRVVDTAKTDPTLPAGGCVSECRMTSPKRTWRGRPGAVHVAGRDGNRPPAP